ncbi:MAG: helix-turn-helix transcriptional regulator [Ruminococcaceae bacterium]|nr:helix-turn-helix transcriptional regulator [Oscillospiraceae bacterium]
MSYFSEKIKELRLKNALTQKQIAQELGISQGNYSGLENGKNDPSLSTLQALSDYYGELIDSLVQPFRIVEDADEISLAEEERLLVRKFRRLNLSDKVEIQCILDFKLGKYPNGSSE